MKRHRTGRILPAMLIASFALHSAWAQTITGVVSGTVVDSASAAVPGA